MTVRRRTAVAALLLATAAGCASGGDTRSLERPYEGLAFDISQVPTELRVPQPKDLRGIPPCKLLTDAQLAEVGLRADTAEEEYPAGNGRGCRWLLVDDRYNYAIAGGSADQQNPALPGLYVTRQVNARFEPLVIAGHPGVRADLDLRGGCDIAVAASDDQLLGANGNAAGKPTSDECGRSRRMIELMLSNLHPDVEPLLVDSIKPPGRGSNSPSGSPARSTPGLFGAHRTALR